MLLVPHVVIAAVTAEVNTVVATNTRQKALEVIALVAIGVVEHSPWEAKELVPTGVLPVEIPARMIGRIAAQVVLLEEEKLAEVRPVVQQLQLLAPKDGRCTTYDNTSRLRSVVLFLDDISSLTLDR
jgi:hypothetical protein